VDDAGPPIGHLDVRHHTAHRLLAGVLAQDADDHRGHLERADRPDLALDGPHQDLTRVDRPLAGVHVWIGAINHDSLGMLGHLL